MFPVKRLLLLLPLVALLSSCSEDFEVAAPYKAVTVIYGLLDPGDTAHYIRIQKAFLDEHKSALDMAKNPDSNFYGSIEVHLKELSDTGRNGTLLGIEQLQRVDLNMEGFPKSSGAFFDKPNYAYKTKQVLIPTRTYRLVVTNTVTGQVDSAETIVIENKPLGPPAGFSVPMLTSFFSLNFPVVLEKNEFAIQVQVPQFSQIYEGIIRFHYMERSASGAEVRDSVEWQFATAARDNDPNRFSVSLSTPQRSFYYFLRDAIGPAPANASRFLDSTSVFIWAASKDMADYQKINGAQGGITADQIKPLYTNIRSNRGAALGLFSSRAHIVRHDVPIDDRSLDSLMKNPITNSLVIRGRTID